MTPHLKVGLHHQRLRPTRNNPAPSEPMARVTLSRKCPTLCRHIQKLCVIQKLPLEGKLHQQQGHSATPLRAPPPSPPASQGSLPGQRPAWHRSLCHAGRHLLKAIWLVTQRASCKLDLHVATPPRTRPPAHPCTSLAPRGSVWEQQFLYRMLLAGPLCEPALPTSTWHSDMVCSGHTTRRLRPLTGSEPCWEKGRAVDTNLHWPPQEKNEVVRGSWGCYGQSRRASLLKSQKPFGCSAPEHTELPTMQTNSAQEHGRR